MKNQPLHKKIKEIEKANRERDLKIDHLRMMIFLKENNIIKKE